MSAFIVSKEHIDAMCALALHGPSGREINPDSAWHPFSYSKYDFAELDTPLDQEWVRPAQGLEAERPDRTSIDATGEMLVMECVRSVSYRYDSADDLPGPIAQYWTEYYSYERPRRIPTAVEGLKLISCYEYQSCEHPEWPSSEAQRFCNALRDALISHLDGYSEAPWEWRTDRVLS